MPHVVLEGPVDLHAYARDFEPILLRRGKDVLRADRVFLERERRSLLIEVLVVVGIVALLISVLLPGLSAAREQGRAVVCRSNIRQIELANEYYAEDTRGVYCPGASEFLRNLHRWHGQRDKPSEPFDSTRGPLVPYLGPDGAIRQCPTFPADEIAAVSGGFERGNGGYGYNNRFVGVQLAESSPGVYVVTEDRAGIGYSGIGYKTSGVKALSLSKESGGTAYAPTYEDVLQGNYPLGRTLYIYVVREPNKPLPKLAQEFLKLILSKEGQEIVVKDGYLPLPAAVAEKQRAALGQ